MKRARSNRRSPLEEATKWVEKDEDPPGFCVTPIPQKGRGVKTVKKFRKGDFLVHYAGELVSGEEGDRREEISSSGYRFFFKAKGKNLCIDATEETGRLGRLVNHGEKNEINCTMKQVQGTLCLFCTRDIQEGEELLYNYGINDLPWKKKKPEMTRSGFSDVPWIVVINKDGRDGPKFYLESTYCLLGKSKNCDIIVNCPGVKQVECMLEMRKKKVYLTDYSAGKSSYFLKQKDTFAIKSRQFRMEYPDRDQEHCIEREVQKWEDTEEVNIDTKDTEEVNIDTKETEEVNMSTKETEEVNMNTKETEEVNMDTKETEELNMSTKETEEVNMNTNETEEGNMNTNETEEVNLNTKETEEVNMSTKETEEVNMNTNETEEVNMNTKETEEVNMSTKETEEVNMNTNETEEVNMNTKETEEVNMSTKETEEVNMNTNETEEMNMNTENTDEAEESISLQQEDTELGDLEEEDNDMDEDWIPHSESELSEDSVDGSSHGQDWVSDSEVDCGDDNLHENKHLLSDSDSEDDPSIKKLPVQNHTGTSDSDSHLSSVLPDIKSQPHVIMQLSVNSENKKMPKVHCCFYCEKMYMRISRHYEQIHSNERDVANILILPKKSKKRKAMWAKLVNKGNYHHNYQVLEKKQGVIIPKYRPRKHEEKEHVQYVPCEFCLGSYVCTDLWKHQKTCCGKVEKTKEIENRFKTSCIENGKLLLPTVGQNQEFYEHILVKMRNDAITHAVQSDQLILLLGTRLYEKNGQHVHQHQYITQRLRELARLLIQIKEDNPTLGLSLSTCILPCNWNILINAVKAVAGYDDKTHTYSIPSLPLKLGHSLSKCAKLVKTASIMNNDEAAKQNADNFLELYKCEWTERVSSQALTTLHDAKFNTPKYIPMAEDVKLLHSYLHTKGNFLKRLVMNDLDHYNNFAEVCLAQLILFNRKRSGETERIEVQDFEEGILANDIPKDTDVVNSLSEFEKELCKSHWRIEIKGKRGRKVPVLFTADIKTNIEALLEARKKLNLRSKYLFMKQNNQYPIRGCDCLKKFAYECGAKFPELLTSTRLRKHLATMTQVLGLTEANQDMIAQFMGHDIRVHRQFYRLPENMLELAKVSKVLHLINSGTVSTFKGKDFDEIEFSQTEEIDEEVETDEDDDDDDDTLSQCNEAETDDDENDDDTLSTTVVRKQKTQAKARSWSVGEQAAVMRHLKHFIKDQCLPGKRHCEQAKKAEPLLEQRTWQQIKHFIRNKITAARKAKFNVKI